MPASSPSYPGKHHQQEGQFVGGTTCPIPQACSLLGHALQRVRGRPTGDTHNHLLTNPWINGCPVESLTTHPKHPRTSDPTRGSASAGPVFKAEPRGCPLDSWKPVSRQCAAESSQLCPGTSSCSVRHPDSRPGYVTRREILSLRPAPRAGGLSLPAAGHPLWQRQDKIPRVGERRASTGAGSTRGRLFRTPHSRAQGPPWAGDRCVERQPQSWSARSQPSESHESGGKSTSVWSHVTTHTFQA